VKSTDCTDKSTCWIHLWPNYINWFFKQWSNNWDLWAQKHWHEFGKLSLDYIMCSWWLKIF